MLGKITEETLKNGKKVYFVDLGNAFYVTFDKDLAEKVSEIARQAFEEVFDKFVEESNVTPEEIDELVSKSILEDLKRAGIE